MHGYDIPHTSPSVHEESHDHIVEYNTHNGNSNHAYFEMNDSPRG